MRQWLINPQYLCNKHLLGEHVEHHMFIGTILKKKSIKGYIDNHLIEVNTLYKRHSELVIEMKNRNFNHQSELPLIRLWKEGYVNRKENLKELCRRCKECRKRILNKKGNKNGRN